jgi:hypothetical protein
VCAAYHSGGGARAVLCSGPLLARRCEELSFEVVTLQPLLEAPQPAQGPLRYVCRSPGRGIAAAATATARRSCVGGMHGEGVDDLDGVHDAHSGNPLRVIAAQEVSQRDQVFARQAHLSSRILGQINLQENECRECSR